MKPIEPGCLALIIAGKHAGTPVTVLRWITPTEDFHGCRFAAEGWLITPGPELYGSFPSRELLRIDGGDDERVTERQGEEVDA